MNEKRVAKVAITRWGISVTFSCFVVLRVVHEQYVRVQKRADTELAVTFNMAC